ncbi:MAG: HAMP domain-containing protein [gamma proteobacterium symbiont of Taylorina sp.]|nr:HAMP domain-containing protein [gamma proteobacterium symbiont of Taylorina sp.]
MTLLPKTLFGRLILVLLTGLILAQLLSAIILLRDRGQVLYESIRENMIVRTTGIVQLLNSLPAPDREHLIPLLASPELRIKLAEQPLEISAMDQNSKYASQKVKQRLAQHLPPATNIRISIIDGSVMPTPFQWPPMHRRHMQNGFRAAQNKPHAMARFFHLQIQLQDDSWVFFERGIPENTFIWPGRLLLVLLILLISVILLSLIAVRFITKPLKQLRQAAEGLGKNIQQAPLEETGPSEISETAKAFNTMQRRLKNYIEDKANILAAVSHDLKTPLTRMRLRTDLMDDKELSDKMQLDLDDMENMVTATLNFMRGIEITESIQQVDLMALLESIQEDVQMTGQSIELEGMIKIPYTGKPLSLKRCINNLLENAIRYGKQVSIKVEDSDDNITIFICDKGPGIPEDALKKVFEPFFRLDSSRAKHTGGTGLGLGIARNIARSHGGELSLTNQSTVGLCAKLTLPK